MATEFKPDYAIHPGVILKEDMELAGLKQSELSKQTGISKTIINEIIKGKRKINAEIAVLLESALFYPAQYWLKLQSTYDETIARIKLNKQNKFESKNELTISYVKTAEISFSNKIYPMNIDTLPWEAA